MRKISVVAALLFIIPSQASAADWVLLGESDNGANTTYLDRSSIKSTGSIRRYWTRQVYVTDPDGWKETQTVFESNCATDQRRILQYVIYMVDGTSRQSPSIEGPLSYVIPDSVEEAAHDYVCAQ